MPHTVDLLNTFLDLTLVTEKELNDDSPPFRELYKFLREWAVSGSIKELTFIQDGGDPLLYAWRAERTDTRVLDSTFLFDSATDLDPDLTIDLSLSWPLSVIQAGAKTRAQIIQIRADYGLISFSAVFA